MAATKGIYRPDVDYKDEEVDDYLKQTRFNGKNIRVFKNYYEQMRRLNQWSEETGISFVDMFCIDALQDTVTKIPEYEKAQDIDDVDAGGQAVKRAQTAKERYKSFWEAMERQFPTKEMDISALNAVSYVFGEESLTYVTRFEKIANYIPSKFMTDEGKADRLVACIRYVMIITEVNKAKIRTEKEGKKWTYEAARQEVSDQLQAIHLSAKNMSAESVTAMEKNLRAGFSQPLARPALATQAPTTPEPGPAATTPRSFLTEGSTSGQRTSSDSEMGNLAEMFRKMALSFERTMTTLSQKVDGIAQNNARPPFQPRDRSYSVSQGGDMCSYCGKTSDPPHQRRDCTVYQDDLRNGYIVWVNNKLCLGGDRPGESGPEVPYRAAGGQAAWVSANRKGKAPKAETSTSARSYGVESPVRYEEEGIKGAAPISSELQAVLQELQISVMNAEVSHAVESMAKRVRKDGDTSGNPRPQTAQKRREQQAAFEVVSSDEEEGGLAVGRGRTRLSRGGPSRSTPASQPQPRTPPPTQGSRPGPSSKGKGVLDLPLPQPVPYDEDADMESVSELDVGQEPRMRGGKDRLKATKKKKEPAYHVISELERQFKSEELIEEVLGTKVPVTLGHLLGASESTRKEVLQKIQKKRVPNPNAVADADESGMEEATARRTMPVMKASRPMPAFGARSSSLVFDTSQDQGLPTGDKQLPPGVPDTVRAVRVKDGLKDRFYSEMLGDGRLSLGVMRSELIDFVERYLSHKDAGHWLAKYSTAYAAPCLYLDAHVGTHAKGTKVLVDTGSEITVCSLVTALRLKLFVDVNTKTRMKNVNGSVDLLIGCAHDVLVNVSGISRFVHVWVIDISEEMFIAGRPWQKSVCLKIQDMPSGDTYLTLHEDGMNGRKLVFQAGTVGDARVLWDWPTRDQTGEPTTNESPYSMVYTRVYRIDMDETCTKGEIRCEEKESADFDSRTPELLIAGVQLISNGQETVIIRESKKARPSSVYIEEKGRQIVLNGVGVVKDEDEVLYAVVGYTPLVHVVRQTTIKPASGPKRYKPVHRKVRPAARSGYAPAWVTPLKSEEDIVDEMRDRRKTEPCRVTEERMSEMLVGVDGSLTEQEKEEFFRVLKKNDKALAFTDAERGRIDPAVVPPAQIRTIPHVPWNQAPPRYSQKEEEEIVEIIKEKMRAHVAEFSNSQYASRWFVLRKKNGSLRWIQDLQPLNAVTVRDVGSVPNVDQMAELCAGRAIYSMGDMYSGYDQVGLHPDSRPLTAMHTPLGLVHMMVLPQGSTISVAYFQRAMVVAFRGFIPSKMQVYVDDMPILGARVEEAEKHEIRPGVRKYVQDHIDDLDKILQTSERANLTFSGLKSVFGVSQVVVLGWLCSSEGIKPDKSKVVKIMDWPEEFHERGDVYRFLGVINWFRRFIPDIVSKLEPLRLLLRKGVEFSWGDEQRNAVRAIKEVFKNEDLVLVTPVYRDEKEWSFILEVDWSQYGWGAHLLQRRGSTREERTVGFFGGTANATERRYAQVKGEVLAAVKGLKAVRHYVYGREFILRMDASGAIGLINSAPVVDPTLSRWVGFIKLFTFTIEKIKGEDNVVADAISRRPDYVHGEVPEAESSDLSSFSILRVSRAHRPLEEEEEHMPPFLEEEYEGEWVILGRFLRGMPMSEQGLSEEEMRALRKRVCNYQLLRGYIVKVMRGKRKGLPNFVRVVGLERQQREIVAEMHDGIVGGHRGEEATRHKISVQYWWPRMGQMVHEWVLSCPECQKRSWRREREEHIPQYVHAILFKVNIDTFRVGKKVQGYEFVVSAIEDATGYIDGEPLRNLKAAPVAKFLLNYVRRYGIVHKFVADRGSEFKAEEVIRALKAYGIALRFSNAGHPQGNAVVERSHGPVREAIVKWSRRGPEDWPSWLGLAYWAHNVTVRASTGYTPFQLWYGRHCPLPIEFRFDTPATSQWRAGISTEELITLRIEQLSETEKQRLDAMGSVNRSRDRHVLMADTRIRQRKGELQVGDLVLVWDYTLEKQWSRKWDDRWLGPYVIVELTEGNSAVLAELDGSEHREAFSTARLKLFRKRSAEDKVFERPIRAARLGVSAKDAPPSLEATAVQRSGGYCNTLTGFGLAAAHSPRLWTGRLADVCVTVDS